MWYFVFKQKTAYEMRISDWSSDVCSSDLDHIGLPLMMKPGRINGFLNSHAVVDHVDESLQRNRNDARASRAAQYHEQFSTLGDDGGKIGRASCRDRECQYV